MRKALLPALVVLMLPACGILGPKEARVIGRIDPDDPTRPVLAAPDSVRSGESFTINVITSGNSCVRGGDTEIEVQGQIARITPFDFRKTNANCADLQQWFEHRAVARFDEGGDAVIVLKALDLLGNPVEMTWAIWVE